MIDTRKMARDVAQLRQQLGHLDQVWNAIEQNATQGIDRHRDNLVGEVLAEVTKTAGKVAAAYLFRAEWLYQEPEWFDHRLHVLDPEEHWNDFWTASSDNCNAVLPLGGKLLDLCSGDGFYDYWFYRYRASKIIAVERNHEVFEFAVKHHSDPRITYVEEDILKLNPAPDSFDVVIIRGAIEHFSQRDQQLVFELARNVLKPGGYFCGDTPAKRGTSVMLGAHEYEWADEIEMREHLGRVFDQGRIMTRTMVSELRTTLIWQCQK